MKLVSSSVRVVVFECTLMLFFLVGNLVNMHFVLCVWFIHVAEDEVHGSFDVVVALAKPSSCLLFSESHTSDHHDSLFANLRSIRI